MCIRDRSKIGEHRASRLIRSGQMRRVRRVMLIIRIVVRLAAAAVRRVHVRGRGRRITIIALAGLSWPRQDFVLLHLGGISVSQIGSSRCDGRGSVPRQPDAWRSVFLVPARNSPGIGRTYRKVKSERFSHFVHSSRVARSRSGSSRRPGDLRIGDRRSWPSRAATIRTRSGIGACFKKSRNPLQ